MELTGKGVGGGRGNRRTLSTGEVAKLFGVAARTVVGWATRGKIPYYRLPSGNGTGRGGTGDRRFFFEDVVAFAEREGVPWRRIAAGRVDTWALIVTSGRELAISLEQQPKIAQTPLSLRVVDTWLAAGGAVYAVPAARPAAVVIDGPVMGWSDSVRSVQSMLAVGVPILLIVPEDVRLVDLTALVSEGVTLVESPVDYRVIASWLESYLVGG